MELNEFDTFTRQLGGPESSRRQALWLLGGALLGGVATRLGLTEDTAAKSKRKRREGARADGPRVEGKRKKHRSKDRDKKRDKKGDKEPKAAECYSDAACGACERCIGGTCLELVPPCDPDACREAFCNPDTNSWECRSTCQHPDAVCCTGECFAPCSNGCQINVSCDACDQPPPGKAYCPGSDTCVEGCPPGESWNPTHCTCEECEARCNPQTGAVEAIGCLAHEVCNGGRCQSWCPPPNFPGNTKACSYWNGYGTVETVCAPSDWTCYVGGGCPPNTDCPVDPTCRQPA